MKAIIIILMLLWTIFSIGCIDSSVREMDSVSVYKLTLIDTGIDEKVHTIYDVYDFEVLQSGNDTFGNVEYTVDVFYYFIPDDASPEDSLDVYKTNIRYQEINEYSVGSTYNITRFYT